MVPTASTGTRATEDESLTHRDRLLRQGLRSFHALGFHGTTVDAILESSGVPKGSFYHHFGSKESFAHAVLEQYLRFQLDTLRRWADREDLTTPEKVEGYFDEIVSNFVRSGHQQACLAGKFSAELAPSSESFRVQVNAGFESWNDILVSILATGQERGDIRRDRRPDDLAMTVFALVQGGFVLGLSERSHRALESARATLRVVLSPPA